MADRPIIFSGPMVRALMEGRKTQTRRVLKPQPQPLPIGMLCKWHIPGKHVGFNMTDEQMHRLGPQFARYAPGDRLYVREAWRAEAVYDDTPPRNLEFDSCQICYGADQAWSDRDAMSVAGRLRPSIHMPRWASRLTLTVTDVRVQRLHDISEADAFAEGCARWGMDGPQGSVHYTVVEDFKRLWNSLHGPEAWDANPWVVALTFSVERRNIDARGDNG